MKKIIHSFIYNHIKTIINFYKYRPLNCYPLGHFYSPIVSKSDLAHLKSSNNDFDIPGIDINEVKQLNLLKEFIKYYHEIPFSNFRKPNFRYFYNNTSFQHTDAIILYSFLRHFRPKQIIEIGCGYSSALMIDTIEILDLKTKVIFIEPYPKKLKAILNQKDFEKTCLITSKVQNVDLQLFKELKENDILFIDSSHVSKSGSDVNFEVFDILPSLNSGVIVHIHDVFFPFEYPIKWIKEGRNWNELYMIRSFLSYNKIFNIIFFTDFLQKKHTKYFEKMPESFRNNGGSLWLKKV